MSSERIKKDECPHQAELKTTETTKKKCDVCDVTQHLRLCTSCGGAFCCESDNAHNREHFEATGHPLIVSLAELPYHFTWCWVCNAYLAE